MHIRRRIRRYVPRRIPRGLSLALLVLAGLLGLVVGRAGVGVGEVSQSSGGTAAAAGTSEQQVGVNESSAGTVFHDAFNGNPDQPTSRMNALPGWFAQPVMQGTTGWDTAPEPMMAQHAANCGAPPGSHHIETYADTVFSCKDHLMTALNPPSGGTASGEVVLKPYRRTPRPSASTSPPTPRRSVTGGRPG